MPVRIAPWLLVAVALAGAGCSRPAGPAAVPEEVRAFVTATAPSPKNRLDVDIDGRVRLLGCDLDPALPVAGRPLSVTCHYRVDGSFDTDYQHFAHLESLEGAGGRIVFDHNPLGGRYPTSRWQKGQYISDRSTVRLPPAFPAGRAVLYTGFFLGDRRLPVRTAGATDRDGRIRAALIKVEPGTALVETRYTAYRAAARIAVDGVAEAAWENAPWTPWFVDNNGIEHVQPRTRARMLWDDDYLYFLFECEDGSIATPHTRRDDPLYRDDAVEIMLDADSDGKTYHEIQLSPANVLFDAFWPERRVGMETGWNPAILSGARVEGTLNRPDDRDLRWTAELAVPFADIRNRPGPLPIEGEAWRINLYRMDRDGERQRGSMWAPVLSGDFHMPRRFGTVVFTRTAPPPPRPPADLVPGGLAPAPAAPKGSNP